MRLPVCRTLSPFNLISLYVALILCVQTSGAEAQSQLRQAMLEAGTVIPVRLAESLSSRESRKGDAFTAKLRVEDRGDYSGLPAGTVIEGTVREVRARRGDEPGVLDLDFHRLRFPGGRSYPIQGSLIGLDAKSVTKTTDGRLVAKSTNKNDRAAFVGYGAGIGLIVGILRKRPVEDTLLGAGLGYLLGSTQRARTEARDVVLKAGTELGVRLDGRFRYADLEESALDADIESPLLRRSREQGGDAPRADDDAEDGEATIPQHRRESDHDGAFNTSPEVKAGEVEVRDSAADIGVLIGEEEVLFDANARPVVTEGKILVPVLAVLKAARIRYRFDQEKQEWTVMADDATLRVSAGSRVVLVNGSRRVRLSLPMRRLNGTLYAPLKFFELVFAQMPEWDAATRTVLLAADEEAKEEKP